jgi:hypothetical protein
MRTGRHMIGMLAALIGLGASAAPLPRMDPTPREPPKPRPTPRTDGDRLVAKVRKRERAEERALRRGGVPGAGLWRKCRAGGRVRGW